MKSLIPKELANSFTMRAHFSTLRFLPERAFPPDKTSIAELDAEIAIETANRQLSVAPSSPDRRAPHLARLQMSTTISHSTRVNGNHTMRYLQSYAVAKRHTQHSAGGKRETDRSSTMSCGRAQQPTCMVDPRLDPRWMSSLSARAQLAGEAT